MKRYVAIGALVLVVAAVGFVLLEPRRALLGYLQGQKFYRGKPSRYWAGALADQGSTTHAEARAELKSGGAEAVPVLVELMRPNGIAKDAVRCEAAGILGEMGPEARSAAPALVEAMKDQDPQLRVVAIKAVQTVGARASEAVPALIPLLQTRDRLAALQALSQYAGEAQEAVPALVPLLKDEQSEVRWNAAWVLGLIGPEARRALPEFVAAMKKDEDPEVREHAAEALGDMKEAAAAAVADLVEALKDDNARVRRDAARSLGQIGQAARPAIPALKELANDKEKRVRDAAETALHRIEPPTSGR